MDSPHTINDKRALALALILAFSAGGIGAIAAEPVAQAPKDPASADFKVVIAFYGAGKEPITKAELFVRRGVAYHFASEAPQEILIFDPAAARLELLDLERKIQAEILLTKLEKRLSVVQKAIEGAIRKHEEAGGRADRVAAEMSRALIDPKLSETYDLATHHLRLTNPVVTADAIGDPVPDAVADADRLALIETALSAQIKLDAVRDPKAIPPYIRLEALHALMADHHLRPAEMTFVYRLAGPPRRLRWTYRLVDKLTAREIEALNRVINLRERIRYVPFDRYESRETHHKGTKDTKTDTKKIN